MVLGLGGARKSSSCLTAAGLRLVSRPAGCRPAAPAAPASAGSPGPPCCVLRVEAPRRVRRRSEGARVLHRLHAPVGKVLVMLELVGVVLQNRTPWPAASPGPRARRAPSRGAARCRPRPPAQSGRFTARPCAPALWPGPSSASGCPGPPRQWRCGPWAASCGARPPRAASGPAWKLVAQVRRDHEVPVVPCQILCGALVARPTAAFLFCRGSTAASQVKTSITTRPYFVFPRVFWLKSMRSACSRSLGPRRPTCPARAAGAPAPAGPSAP